MLLLGEEVCDLCDAARSLREIAQPSLLIPPEMWVVQSIRAASSCRLFVRLSCASSCPARPSFTAHLPTELGNAFVEVIS